MQSIKQKDNLKFCFLHKIQNCYAYCIYDDCKEEKRWLCVQCYLKKTHNHMNLVLTQYYFVVRIQQSIDYFNKSRICEITNILEQLQSEEIHLNIILSNLKPICKDTRETYLKLFQMNDFKDIFGQHNNQIEFLRTFITNHEKWSNYFYLVKESIFHYTQRFSFKNNLISRLNLLLRSPNQFYIKQKHLNHQLNIKQIIISPNQQFLSSIQKNTIRIFFNNRMIRKKLINVKLTFITFNLDSTQICAGSRDGNILIFNMLDLSYHQFEYPRTLWKIDQIVYTSRNQIFILSSNCRIVKLDLLTKKALFEIKGQVMQFNKTKNQLITLYDQFLYFRDAETGSIINWLIIDDDFVQQFKFIESQDIIVSKFYEGRMKTQKYPEKADMFHNQSKIQTPNKLLFALNQNILLLVNSKEIILLYSYNLNQIKTIDLVNDLSNYKICKQQYDSRTLIIENKSIQYNQHQFCIGKCCLLKLK